MTGGTQICLMCGEEKILKEFTFIPRRNSWRCTCIACDSNNPPYKYLSKYNLKPCDLEGNDYILPFRGCSSCNTVKQISEFRFVRKRWDKGIIIPQGKCRVCYSLQKKVYKLNTRYGISIKGYEDLLKKQDGKCAICKKPKILFVDHNHNTNVNRGLLCHHCNVAIGFLDEDTEIILNAIMYLKNTTL